MTVLLFFPWYRRFFDEFDGVGFATEGYESVSFTLNSIVGFLGDDKSMLNWCY